MIQPKYQIGQDVYWAYVYCEVNVVPAKVYGWIIKAMAGMPPELWYCISPSLKDFTYSERQLYSSYDEAKNLKHL